MCSKEMEACKEGEYCLDRVCSGIDVDFVSRWLDLNYIFFSLNHSDHNWFLFVYKNVVLIPTAHWQHLFVKSVNVMVCFIMILISR